MNKIDIFYADDDEDDLLLFKEAVEKVASDLKSALGLHLHPNGNNLIENIKKDRDSQAIVFLDINMPLQSGTDLLQQIRTAPGIMASPVIMYSTSSSPNNIELCQSLGADFYVIKPIKFSDLTEMIANFIHINWQNRLPEARKFLYKHK